MARRVPRLLRALAVIAACGSLSACVVAPARPYYGGGYYRAPVYSAPVYRGGYYGGGYGRGYGYGGGYGGGYGRGWR